MKTEHIRAMAFALEKVKNAGKLEEKKLDKVDKSELKGSFKDREDKDIDNDGDTDNSDRYLHARRKAASKNIKKGVSTSGGKKEIEVETQVQEEHLDELSKNTLGSYVKKAGDSMYKHGQAAQYHTNKSNKAQGPFSKQTKNKHDELANKANNTASKRSDGISRAVNKITKEETAQQTFVERYKKKAEESGSVVDKTDTTHVTAPTVAVESAYATTDKEKMPSVNGPAQSVQPSKDVKQGKETSATKDTSKLDKTEKPLATDGVHAIKHNDEAENKSQAQATSQTNTQVESNRYGGVAVLESRKPVSMRDALAMMYENRVMHTKGATAPQAYDDNWSPKAKEWAKNHGTDTPDESNIDKAIEKNKTEVAASLNRKVNYRHNDQQIGDKKTVGNDGK